MDTKARRRLPIGLQTFRELREEDCYYVDKTGFIARLLDEGKHYFLSRPRRFGKSLFLDTLKELFEGHEALFTGLHIHDRWDWSLRHPVVRLDFGGGHFGEPGYVHSSAMAQLAAAAQDGGVAASYDTAPERFRDLLRVLHARTGRRVVVLVDEYDKPLLDALDTPDVARANRDYLLGLYSTIKSSDADVHFTLLSGVSTFSMASVFSGLNNLTDITLNPCYSAICGYTEADLDTVFTPELPGLDRERIRHWYDGYNWRGAERVYNGCGSSSSTPNRGFWGLWGLLEAALGRRYLTPSEGVVGGMARRGAVRQYYPISKEPPRLQPDASVRASTPSDHGSRRCHRRRSDTGVACAGVGPLDDDVQYHPVTSTSYTAAVARSSGVSAPPMSASGEQPALSHRSSSPGRLQARAAASAP